MARSAKRDPLLEQAREEAEGTELLERPDRDALLEKEREEAQGVEVFEDPDATLPGSALIEGSPGQEAFTADAVGLQREEDMRADDDQEDERG